MQMVLEALFGLGKMALVLVINVSLFLIIPVAHELLGLIDVKKEEVAPERKIVAEYIRPKPKETKPEPKTHLRSVSNASSQPIQQQMKFSFTPDLSVAGGAGGVGIETQELTAEVFEEGEVEKNATPLFTPPPKYPERARDLAIEGEAVITFIIGVDGKVMIEDIQAPHPSFAPAIRQSLSEWKFKPAENKGIPVKQRSRQVIDFNFDS